MVMRSDVEEGGYNGLPAVEPMPTLGYVGIWDSGNVMGNVGINTLLSFDWA